MEPRGRRRTGTFLLLLLVALGYVALQSREGRFERVQSALYLVAEVPVSALSWATEHGRGAAADLFRREHLRARITNLERRLAALEVERASLTEAGRENERLEELLALKQQTRAATRGARILSADVSGAFRSVVIDAGARDGVRKDAAVVAADGLVGRVVKVGASTAVVQLVDDAASGVGVVVERSRVQGVLVGAGRLECRLKYVPNLEDVKAEDRVLASGLDGIYPKGVLVGTVTSAGAGADAFLDVKVRPAVALARLETVLVFVPPGDGAIAPLRDGLAEAFRTPAAGTLR